MTPPKNVTTPTKSGRGRVITLWGIVLLLVLYVWYSRQQHEPNYSLRIIKTPVGWGYEISKDNKPLIYQATKPGVAGGQGFADEAHARRVGQRVVDKLRQGKFPPTLQPEELR